MDNNQETTLKWLADQQFNEHQSLRTAEDSLFNWSTSLFLAGFGALTGIKGATGASWGFLWRVLVIVGVAGMIVAILLLASLLRTRQQNSLRRLGEILTQLAPASPIPLPAPTPVDDWFFYVRWGALGVLGLITLALVWMLG